jgi:hypothetical protein
MPPHEQLFIYKIYKNLTLVARRVNAVIDALIARKSKY